MSEYHDACARLVGHLADEFMTQVVASMGEAELREMVLRYIRQAREAQALRAEHLADVKAVHELAAEIAGMVDTVAGGGALDLTVRGAQQLDEKVQQLRAMLPRQ